LLLVELDVIGEHTEINVTSPTGMRIMDQTDSTWPA
jgi:hypothetical protein